MLFYLCGEAGEFTGDVKPLITELIKLPTTDIVFGGGEGEFGTFWSPNDGGNTWNEKISIFRPHLSNK